MATGSCLSLMCFYMVDRRRIELLPEACKATVLPLSLTAQINLLLIPLYAASQGEIITYYYVCGNWWSLKESNHPPATLQLKATDLQSAEGNRLQKNTTGFAFFPLKVEFLFAE